MNVRYIVLLSAISLIAAEACDINVEDGGDISYEDAANKAVPPNISVPAEKD